MNRQQALAALGLDESASPEKIKQTYRKLAMRHHPDRNAGDAGAEERFKAVKQAYDFLADGMAGLGVDAGLAPGDLGDLFGEVFANIFGAGAFSPPPVARISLGQAARGCEIELSLAPWGGTGSVTAQLPAGIPNGAELEFEVAGRRRIVEVEVHAPPGWEVEGACAIASIRLTLLDQLLGATARGLALPDGALATLRIPPGWGSGSILWVDHAPLRPYRVGWRVDFSGPLRLNDTERDQLEAVRASVTNRGGENGK